MTCLLLSSPNQEGATAGSRCEKYLEKTNESSVPPRARAPLLSPSHPTPAVPLPPAPNAAGAKVAADRHTLFLRPFPSLSSPSSTAAAVDAPLLAAAGLMWTEIRAHRAPLRR